MVNNKISLSFTLLQRTQTNVYIIIMNKLINDNEDMNYFRFPGEEMLLGPWRRDGRTGHWVAEGCSSLAEDSLKEKLSMAEKFFFFLYKKTEEFSIFRLKMFNPNF